ncbi:MAG: hypothetical protein ACJ8FY_28145 [Gemmataceae bacterium]
MTRLGILGVTTFAFAMLASGALAQRRAGAVVGGMRGAAVGGMVGGSEGAEKGAKIGVVTGVTRSAINRETTARTQYEATTEYQNAQHSNFNEAPPEVFGTTADASAKKSSGEAPAPGAAYKWVDLGDPGQRQLMLADVHCGTYWLETGKYYPRQGDGWGEACPCPTHPPVAVIRKDDKPIVGITFPSDWKQKTGDNCVSAVSGDGNAYSMLAVLEKVADKEGGIKMVKEGLENYLKDVKYDDPSETKGGAVIITGAGKGKKAGVDVVFAVGIFDAGKGQLAGAAFVVDAKMDDYYKETVRGICQTIRRKADFAK